MSPMRGFIAPHPVTGAGARSAEGADTGYDNAESIACVGVRVARPVRYFYAFEVSVQSL